MYKTLTAVSVAMLLSACSTMGKSEEANMAKDGKMEDSMEMMQVSEASLQHHHWELTAIDGQPLEVMENFKAPTLEVGEKMSANGHAGCNNFFGQAELKDGKFRIEQMGMTMKMCPEGVMDTEMAFSKALGEWSEVKLTKETLELNNSQHNLTFTLKDWKN